jgi:ArsR family transcriptional regulator, arsenate/arsenite/antimonite-responsive transcriptional repressor
MAQNKKQSFSPQDLHLAEFARALSHPARIAILRTLAERQMCICGEIVEVLPLAQATVSQHLKELKNIGLVRGSVEGAKSCYCINWAVLEQFSIEMAKFNTNITSKRPQTTISPCGDDC